MKLYVGTNDGLVKIFKFNQNFELSLDF